MNNETQNQDTNNITVYVIKGEYKGKIRTYVGCTNNLSRRLRQHNGFIKGGAKHTTRARPWTLIAHIKGFSTYREALSFEWYLAHRPPKYKCKMQVSINLRFIDIIRVLKRWEDKNNKTMCVCTYNKYLCYLEKDTTYDNYEIEFIGT